MGFFLSRIFFIKSFLTFCLFFWSLSAFPSENAFYKDPTLPLLYELEDTNLVDYWTNERMENAVPKDTAADFSESLNNEQIKNGKLITDFELPMAIAGAVPKTNPGKIIKNKPTDADISLEPHKYGGKLFFTLAGIDYTCSAQLVGAQNILLTAAHCIKDPNTGEWATHSMFVQQFNNGKGEKRKITCLTTKNGWQQKGLDKWRWDYGFMKIQAPIKGGYMGLRTSLEGERWSSMGYPSAFGNGQVMQKITGTLGNSFNNIISMLNNGMGRGSSGGAWYIGNVAIGLNSFIYVQNPSVMWGPDFDKETMALFQYAKNGCK
ncbi:MAG: trypsin-like serine peptidase [Bdellovibrio sp.]